MISCLVLERAGAWRIVGITALLMVVILPAAPLLWGAFGSLNSAADFSGGTFRTALYQSVLLASCVAAVSLVIGLPLGVVSALYEFPGRRVLCALAPLPLLVPSFLWAIGWASVGARLGPFASGVLSGFSGCFLVLSSEGIPLVLLVAHAAVLTLSGSQVDAARLAGGEGRVLRSAAGYAAYPAVLAAGLEGILTLSDPGPGLIFGFSTAASEILVGFSARYDFLLAGRQCVVLAALVLLSAAPLVILVTPRLASVVLARQFHGVRRIRHRGVTVVAGAALALLLLVSVLTPLAGLTLPLTEGTVCSRAIRELARTAGNTIVYAGGAGIIATALGFLLALCAGRSDRLRAVCLGAALALLSMPPTLPALGLIQLAAAAPPWADLFLRSHFTVCVALGLRFFPVAAVLGVRAWGSTSTSWTLAASVHGVPLGTYLWRVVAPILLPAGTVAVLLVALLATADVSTVLLLHPPGESSLPLAIFTVMANAPEALVASLCFVYVTAAAGLLAVVWTIAGGRLT